MITHHRQAAIAAALLTSSLMAGTAWAESHARQPAPVTASALTTGSSQLTPAGLAMRTALAQVANSGLSEAGFYESRAYAPFWLDIEGAATPAAAALLAWVGEADSHGLPTARYGTALLSGQIATPGTRDLAETARIELSLTRLYLTYARDLASGLLEPRRISRNIDIVPERPDPAALLQGVAATADIAAFLNGMAPTDPNYDRLRGLYAEMRARAAEGGWGLQVDRGRTLRPGDRHPRVAQLRARLAARGDLAEPETAAAAENRLASNEVMTDASPSLAQSEPDPLRFDAALEAAVRRFQANQGLNVDGVVGPATLAAVNTTLVDLAAQVAVNLERRRWFDIDPANRNVLVNIANFSMQVFENGAPIFETRTVVGKAGRRFQTAEFNDELEFMVVNPFWNVPYSIASREILPLLREDPTYLERNNMDLLGSDLPSSEIDWSMITQGDFPGRIRQRPGPGNALGFVKFLFPNKHSIYMHDTPSRSLFSRDRRAYSHGCVRLQRPYEFAHLLLSLQEGAADPVATFDRLRARHGEQWVTLDNPIPVYLTYRTVWFDEAGAHHFRTDVYRRDRAVAAALAEAGVVFGI